MKTFPSQNLDAGLAAVNMLLQRLGELKAKGDIIDFHPTSFAEKDGKVYLDLNVKPKLVAEYIEFEFKVL